jgi:hypothetical protein
MPRKYNRVILAIGRSISLDVVRYCLSIRFLPIDVAEVVENPQKYFRDLHRTMKTFLIVSDIEEGGWINRMDKTYIEPFVFFENGEYISSIFFDLAENATIDSAMINIKSGLSAASALLRNAGYKAVVKVRPTVQLELPETAVEKKEVEEVEEVEILEKEIKEDEPL